MNSPMTFGRIVRSIRVGDSVLIETVHPAGLLLPRHDHSNPSLNITLAGSYTESCDRRNLPCDSSTVVLKPAGEFHSNRYGPTDTRCVMVEFGPRAATHIRAFSKVLDRLWTVRGGFAAAAMQELCRELRVADGASPLIVEGCIWRVLGHIERESDPTRLAGRPAWLARVEEFIRENAKRRISLAELAALVGIHPAHLNKVFKRHLGVSVGVYLRQFQIERARRLLAETRISLAHLAIDTGFCDQSHFARVFKSVTGTTPSDYRREARTLRPKVR
jgi:AraC family transcriptional regulator